MIEIYSISSTTVHWHSFMEGAGRPLLSIEPKGFRSYLLALDDLVDTGNALGHLSFTFIVRAVPSDLLEIFAESEFVMSLSTSRDFAIVSGTLKQWKEAIVHHLSQPKGQVEFYNKLMLFFEHIGLGEFWRDWMKVSHPSGVFTLEHR